MNDSEVGLALVVTLLVAALLVGSWVFNRLLSTVQARPRGLRRRGRTS
jgi:hypothetical protein